MEYTLKDFKVGDTVRIHPASDWFMRGVTYGRVQVVGRKWLTLMVAERGGIKVKLSPRNVMEISR